MVSLGHGASERAREGLKYFKVRQCLVPTTKEYRYRVWCHLGSKSESLIQTADVVQLGSVYQEVNVA